MTRPITYVVNLAEHPHHLVHVTMAIPHDLAPGARIVLPTWTPGSYVIRDYARHVQRIHATHDGENIPLDLDGRSAWRLPTTLSRPVEIELELYANELTVRTNHVDDRHALLVPAATLPYVDGARNRRHLVVFELPTGWDVWGLLPHDGTKFVAEDYDQLVDSAFSAGAHEERTFDVAGVPHSFVWAGHGGRPDLDRIVADTQEIAGAAAALFEGDLPVERYTFLCTAWDRGAGGLEHRDGSVLAYPVHRFRTADGYDRFLTLVAHEYLHLWNVKRMVPAALRDLDYEQPVHTTSLWVAEGWTAYYDEVLPVRAGVREPKKLLESLAKQAKSVLERPGRELQSVRQASWEAWTKFYVRDENTPNVGVSYYEHGAMLAWCLDLLLRRDADGDGLDEVMRALWRRFGASTDGYEEADVEAAVEEAAGASQAGFFAAHVSGTDDPPVHELVEVVGLRLRAKAGDDPPPPDLGVEVSEGVAGITFTSVLRDRAAWRGGLSGGDRLVAIDGVRVGKGELDAALRGYEPHDLVEIAVLRGPRLLVQRVKLDPPRPPWELVPVEDPSDEQRRAFARWTGSALDTLTT